MSPDLHSYLTSLIRSRKTEKVLCPPEDAPAVSEETQQQLLQQILEDLSTAGWAPFHYPREVDGIAEPWRATVLTATEARKVALYMQQELGITSKEPLLSAGCTAMVLITWLPELNPEETVSALVSEKRAARDREHLAASSAMVQNFLLLQTARGHGTYWSSGGALGGPEMGRFLKIPQTETLLAAVFIDTPGLYTGQEERKPGAHRDKRCDRWIRGLDES